MFVSVLIYFENVLETKRPFQHCLFTSKPFGLFFLDVVIYILLRWYVRENLTKLKNFVIIYIES